MSLWKPKEEKILICGDRHWTDEDMIAQRIMKIPKGTTIIEGAARGADRIAGKISRKLGFKVIEMPAQWEKHGRAAGPIRNRQMLKLLPSLVIAFHDDLKKSKGTKDCVQAARRMGIKVEVIGH